MIKSNREIKDFSEILAVLSACDTVRIAINGEEYPYVVPLSFGFCENAGKISVYVHGAHIGKKHEYLAKNNKVCLEADIFKGYAETPQGITTIYESVIAYGVATRVENEEAVKGLNLILAHCGYKNYPFNDAAVKATAVYKIEISEITGKRRTL